MSNDLKLSAEAIKSEEVEVPKTSMGRICGKGMANVSLYDQFNTQLRSMEESFKVYLTVRRDIIISVNGEKMNVSRCIEALKDMIEETEITVALPAAQLHALLAHESKYRKQIEQDHRVFIALQGTEAIRIRGGVRAVKAAERAVTDLFRSMLLSD